MGDGRSEEDSPENQNSVPGSELRFLEVSCSSTADGVAAGDSAEEVLEDNAAAFSATGCSAIA